MEGDTTVAAEVMELAPDGRSNYHLWFSVASGMAPLVLPGGQLAPDGDRWVWLVREDPLVERLLDPRWFHLEPLPRVFARDRDHLSERWPLPPGDQADQPDDAPQGLETVARYHRCPGTPAQVLATLDATYPGTSITRAALLGRWRVQPPPTPPAEHDPYPVAMEFRPDGRWTVSWGDPSRDPPWPSEYFVQDGRLVLLVPFPASTTTSTTVSASGRQQVTKVVWAKRPAYPGCAIDRSQARLWLPWLGLLTLTRP